MNYVVLQEANDGLSVATDSCWFDTLQQAIDYCGELVKRFTELSLRRNIFTIVIRKKQFDASTGGVVSLDRVDINPSIVDIIWNQYNAVWLILNNGRYASMPFNQYSDLLEKYDHFFVDYVLDFCSLQHSIITQGLIHLISKTDKFDLQLIEANVDVELNRRIFYKHFVRPNNDENKKWLNERASSILISSTPNIKQALMVSSFIKAVQQPINECDAVYGFKAFYLIDDKLKCRDYHFDRNNPNIITDFVYPCNSGFHFCLNSADLNDYYYVYQESQIVVCKVKAWGTVINDGNKTVCSHLQIVETIPRDEVGSYDFLRWS